MSTTTMPGHALGCGCAACESNAAQGRRAYPIEGLDNEGAPAIAELARAEQAALLSFMPRRRVWRELEDFDARLLDLGQRLASSTERAAELSRELANEPQRHADRIAQWELTGRKGQRPDSDVEHLERELRDARAEIKGLTVATDRVLGERAEHVERHRSRLVQTAEQLANESHQRLTEMLDDVARERDRLTGLREAWLWASTFPREEASRMPTWGTLAGGLRKPHERLGVDRQLEAARVLDALREDADWIIRAVSPDQRTLLEGDHAKPDLRHEATWDATPEGAAAARAERKRLIQEHIDMWGAPPA